MKKIYIFFMMFIFLGNVNSIQALAKENEDVSHIKFSSNCTGEIAVLAAQHLENMKEQIGDLCDYLGFDAEVFSNMSAGMPFTVYTFDEDGNVLADDVFLCPLLYGDEIVGTIGIYYDKITENYCYSLGKSYADELNEFIHATQLKRDKGFVLGRLGDKLFVTDGIHAEIIFDKGADNAAFVSKEEIEKVCCKIKANAGDSYTEIFVRHFFIKRFKSRKPIVLQECR